MLGLHTQMKSWLTLQHRTSSLTGFTFISPPGPESNTDNPHHSHQGLTGHAPPLRDHRKKCCEGRAIPGPVRVSDIAVGMETSSWLHATHNWWGTQDSRPRVGWGPRVWLWCLKPSGTDPRGLEVRLGSGVGGRGLKVETWASFSDPRGPLLPPRSCPGGLPASPSLSQLAVRAEFTVSAVLHVFPRQTGEHTEGQACLPNLNSQSLK